MRTAPRPAVPSRLDVARTFVVVSTAYVVPPAKWDRAPYTEIVLGYDHAADGPRQIFATRDDRIAERAVAAEGSDALFTASAVGTLDGSRRPLRLLTALDPVQRELFAGVTA